MTSPFITIGKVVTESKLSCNIAIVSIYAPDYNHHIFQKLVRERPCGCPKIEPLSQQTSIIAAIRTVFLQLVNDEIGKRLDRETIIAADAYYVGEYLNFNVKFKKAKSMIRTLLQIAIKSIIPSKDLINEYKNNINILASTADDKREHDLTAQSAYAAVVSKIIKDKEGIMMRLITNKQSSVELEDSKESEMIAKLCTTMRTYYKKMEDHAKPLKVPALSYEKILNEAYSSTKGFAAKEVKYPKDSVERILVASVAKQIQTNVSGMAFILYPNSIIRYRLGKVTPALKEKVLSGEYTALPKTLIEKDEKLSKNEMMIRFAATSSNLITAYDFDGTTFSPKAACKAVWDSVYSKLLA